MKGNRVIFSGIPVTRNKRLHPETGAKDHSQSFVQGRSRCMERLSETILKAGKVDAAVVLVGEAGTGKKMIVRDLLDPIHQEESIDPDKKILITK